MTSCQKYIEEESEPTVPESVLHQSRLMIRPLERLKFCLDWFKLSEVDDELFLDVCRKLLEMHDAFRHELIPEMIADADPQNALNAAAFFVGNRISAVQSLRSTVAGQLADASSPDP